MRLALVFSSAFLLLATEMIESSAQTSDLESQLRRRSTSRFGNTTTLRMTPMDVHPKGDYGGVQPGVKTPKSWAKCRKAKNRARRKNIVRWIGFQPKSSGASRLFVQLTGPLEYEQTLQGNDLVIVLQRARLGGSNARRPLDTRFFDTVVRRAVAKRTRRSVTLRISFKNPADAAKATAAMETSESDGYTYLFLDFGAPSGATLEAEASDDDDDDDDGDEGIESVDDDE